MGIAALNPSYELREKSICSWNGSEPCDTAKVTPHVLDTYIRWGQPATRLNTVCKRIVFFVLGLIVVVFGFWISYWLLSHKMIEGSDFVSLTITVLVAAFLLTFLPDLSEVSIAGIVIKLREAKREAELTIGQLQKLLEATFEPQLDAVRMSSGGFVADAYATKDSRIDSFSRLLESIQKAGLTEALKPKIVENAKFFAKEQLKIIERLSGNDGRYSEVSDLPPPSKVASNVFSNEPVSSVAERFKLPVDDLKRKTDAAIKTYRAMYDISRL